MKNVIVLGSTGMLGRYVFNHISKFYPTISVDRNMLDANCTTGNIYEINQVLSALLSEESVVINCIGIIKQLNDSPLSFIAVNSVFPRVVANICEQHKSKMIHVSTDCVFSGKDGNYTEKSPHDALDIYGKSKSLGEPENGTVIRTSIIGEELKGKKSLLEWVKSKENQRINGYTNHRWNGVTCLQLAKVIKSMVADDLYWKGVRHIYSPISVSKYELVQMINEVYNLRITIVPVEADEYCDRSMNSVYNTSSLFDIPVIEEQIKELKGFWL